MDKKSRGHLLLKMVLEGESSGHSDENDKNNFTPIFDNFSSKFPPNDIRILENLVKVPQVKENKSISGSARSYLSTSTLKNAHSEPQDIKNKNHFESSEISANKICNLHQDIYEYHSDSICDEDSRDKQISETYYLSEPAIQESDNKKASVHVSDSLAVSDGKEIKNIEKLVELSHIEYPEPLSQEIKQNNQVESKEISTNVICNLSQDIYEHHEDSIYDDDSRDKDFNISEYFDDSSSTSSKNSNLVVTNESIYDNNYQLHHEPLSEKLKNERNKRKKLIECKYCVKDIDTKNFMRHLQRKHSTIKEVKNILMHPKNSKERRELLGYLRNETNFNLYIKGTIRPNRQPNKSSNPSVKEIHYYPCAYCKGLYMKKYLRRHVKSCMAFKKCDYANQEGLRINHLSQSHTITACAADPTNVISQLNVKEQVFDIMKADDIAFQAKKDLLISHFGNSYLKKHRREGMAYACSTRMRELSRLLITYRNIINNEHISFKDLLHPRCFETVISAVRNISGYDSFKKTFRSPSLAMHMGTSLKLVCDELTNLILKESEGFKCQSPQDCKTWLHDIKNFKKLVESRWNIEIGSIAHKDLQFKRSTKPLLLPLVRDIKIFREETLKIVNKCKLLFNTKEDDLNTYKKLVQCTLSLLIVFNRKRIGDVQYLKIKDYHTDKKTENMDFKNILTETEKILTTKYRRIINTGKGSRAVVILVPEVIQDLINLLLKNRSKYIPVENEYVFAIPNSKIKWGKGDVAIRTLTKQMKLENPLAISSNKLRKHIATVMQILNLSRDETKQFSDFMGHTQKTHEEFYELPVDIYQTAKVSKLLLLMDKGSFPAEYKGKTLAQIDFDPNSEYAEEDEDTPDTPNEILENETLNRQIEKDTTFNVILAHSEEESPDIDSNDTNESSIVQETDIDDGDEDIASKKTTKKKWSNIEVNSLKTEFSSFINQQLYPSGYQINEFIKRSRINRTTAVVRSKLQHLLKVHK